MKIISLGQVAKVENYPYGFKLKTTATFGIEFKNKRGFRPIFQTINPKTLKPNKPKLGIYNTFMYLTDTDGVIQNNGFYVNSFKSSNEMIQFICDNFDALELTDDMLKYIYGVVYSVSRISIAYATDKNALYELLTPIMKELLIGINNGGNITNSIIFDLDLINKFSND